MQTKIIPSIGIDGVLYFLAVVQSLLCRLLVLLVGARTLLHCGKCLAAQEKR